MDTRPSVPYPGDMRLLLPLLVFFLAATVPTATEAQEAGEPVVAVVLGEEIHREPGMDGGELMGVVLGTLLERYAEEHDLEPTGEEIDVLVERMEVPGDGEDRQSERREVAREFVRRFKIDQSLYQEYGGRVIFQQMGPEPIDAYREFLEDRQEAGAFRILDRDLADGFWEYLTNDSIHSFYSPEEAERVMSRPWWERDPAEANDPE